MTCILWMWLAASPAILHNVDQFQTRKECIAARKREVEANVRIGKGGGATYFCGDIERGPCAF